MQRLLWEERRALEQMAEIPLGERRLTRWTLGDLDHLDQKAMSSIPVADSPSKGHGKGEAGSLAAMSPTYCPSAPCENEVSYIHTAGFSDQICCSSCAGMNEVHVDLEADIKFTLELLIISIISNNESSRKCPFHRYRGNKDVWCSVSCPLFHVSAWWNVWSWSGWLNLLFWQNERLSCKSKACFWFGTISCAVIFHTEERETIGIRLEMEQKRVVCIYLGFWCEPVAELLAHRTWSSYEGFSLKTIDSCYLGLHLYLQIVGRKHCHTDWVSPGSREPLLYSKVYNVSTFNCASTFQK